MHKGETKQEVLNQATDGKIASPECMNNYKDEIKCHQSCWDRPIIEQFFVNYPQLCHVISLLQDIRIKTCHTISKILHSNPKLCLKLLLVLKKMYNIKRFHSFINKITRNSKIRMSLKLCKRFAQFCFNKNCWPYCWLSKPVKDISIKSCGKGVQLSVYFDNAEKKLPTGILKNYIQGFSNIAPIIAYCHSNIINNWSFILINWIHLSFIMLQMTPLIIEMLSLDLIHSN